MIKQIILIVSAFSLEQIAPPNRKALCAYFQICALLSLLYLPDFIECFSFARILIDLIPVAEISRFLPIFKFVVEILRCKSEFFTVIILYVIARYNECQDKLAKLVLLSLFVIHMEHIHFTATDISGVIGVMLMMQPTYEL